MCLLHCRRWVTGFEITSQVRGSNRFGLCHIFRALLFSDFSNSELLLLFAWGECRSSVSLFVFVCFFMFYYPFSYSYPLTSQRERASLRVLAHSPAAEYWCLFLDTWLVIGLGCSVPYFPSSIFDRLCLWGPRGWGLLRVLIPFFPSKEVGLVSSLNGLGQEFLPLSLCDKSL